MKHEFVMSIHVYCYTEMNLLFHTKSHCMASSQKHHRVLTVFDTHKTHEILLKGIQVK